MSRAEASVWSAVSVRITPYFHVTSVDAASRIRREGFQLDDPTLTLRGFGRFWGVGVYATPDPDVAARYVSFRGADNYVLELRVDVRRVLTVRLSRPIVSHAMELIFDQVPNGLARYLKIGRAIKSERPEADIRAEALTRLLRETGYDCLEIVELGFTPTIGGLQVVVFDPRNVVIVDD